MSAEYAMDFSSDPNAFKGNAGDDTMYAKFFLAPLQNPEKSIKEGRPIFDEVEFVKIFSPGDRTNIVERPTRPTDKNRFPKQYAMFKNAEEQSASGTPLKQWPMVTSAQVEELKYLGFQTVEQIANAKDEAIGRHMGLQELKNKANAYIELAKGSTAPLEALSKELADSKSSARQLEETVKALAAQVERLTASDTVKTSQLSLKK